MPSTTIPMGTVALALARAGAFVHPLEPGGKAPASRRGLRDATRDPDRIARWWDEAPAMNIGINTGRSGLVVIDADHGKPWREKWGQQPAGVTDGADMLIAAAETADPGSVDSFLGPWSCNVATPGGGMHFYFSNPGRSGTTPAFKSVGSVMPWVDVRAVGGYVVAPWCQTPAGQYRPGAGWTSTTTVGPDGAVEDFSVSYSYPELPAWLAESLPRRPEEDSEEPRPVEVPMAERLQRLLDAPTIGPSYAARAVELETQAVASAVEGSRNHTLHKAAVSLGTLVGAGQLGEGDVVEALAASAGLAGLDRGEAAATIRSGLRWGIQHPREVTVL